MARDRSRHARTRSTWPTIRSLRTASLDPRSDAIVCRQCDALVRRSEGNCPECGTSVRSWIALLAVSVLGLFVLYLSLSPYDGFVAFVGIVLLGIGVSAARDRRRRVREARRRLEP